MHLEAEKITSEAMIALFDRLTARHPAAETIHLVLDNASYNRSAAVKAYLARDGCRIRLVYLPALFAEPEPDRAIMVAAETDDLEPALSDVR